MNLALDFAVLIIGLLLWVLSKDGKINEIGKIMFWTGLLSFLLGDASFFARWWH